MKTALTGLLLIGLAMPADAVIAQPAASLAALPVPALVIARGLGHGR
ncbi:MULTISPECIES: hypothetical protein [Pseudomonas]|nr:MULTISPECIES: hypothetical protein [unclassified Pseudomonas]MBT1262812.1 hypothetical protein [Pseudomonas sp. VS40]MBT1274251.1 hypothetical protein [Pseudomonas sp. VS59]